MSKASVAFLSLLFSLSSLYAQGIDAKYQKLLKKVYTDFPTISCKDAENKVADKNFIFLDTREKKEYLVSHIPGAIWVGYDDFKIERIQNIAKGKSIIVYCSIGARSQTIGEKLKKSGLKPVVNLYGGIFQWSNENRPLADSNENPTKDIHGYDSIWSKWIKKGNIVY